MRYLAHENGYIMKLFVNEKLQESLFDFSARENVAAAHLWGIGAAKDIVLGSYDLANRTYLKRTLSGIWEIASLTGSLARTEEGPILHIHGVFSDEKCATLGGHVFSLVTAATVEIYLVPVTPGLTRKYDEETGLKLLDL